MWQHARTSGLLMLAALPIGLLLSISVAPLFADLIYGVGHRDANSLSLAMAIATAAGIFGTWLPSAAPRMRTWSKS